jgi:hypothetical protein
MQDPTKPAINFNAAEVSGTSWSLCSLSLKISLSLSLSHRIGCAVTNYLLRPEEGLSAHAWECACLLVANIDGGGGGGGDRTLCMDLHLRWLDGLYPGVLYIFIVFLVMGLRCREVPELGM